MVNVHLARAKLVAERPPHRAQTRHQHIFDRVTARPERAVARLEHDARRVVLDLERDPERVQDEPGEALNVTNAFRQPWAR